MKRKCIKRREENFEIKRKKGKSKNNEEKHTFFRVASTSDEEAVDRPQL
jgi:hypothetical protein